MSREDQIKKLLEEILLKVDKDKLHFILVRMSEQPALVDQAYNFLR